MAILTTDTDPFLDGSLISSYLFDSSLVDILGNYNLSGTPTYTTGKFGDALDNYRVATPNWGLSASNKISISLHVNTLIPDAPTPYILYLGTSGDNPAIVLTSKTAYFEGDGDQIADLTFGTIADGQYHHIVFNIDLGAGLIEIYIDNVLANSTTNMALNNTLGDFATATNGICSDYQGNTLDSTVDQMMIFNRALTLSEIQELFLMEEPPSAGSSIQFNGIETTQVFFNGTEVTEVHFNGTLLV